MANDRHCLIILKNDPGEEPLECTLAEAAELLRCGAEEIRQGFIDCGRFDTERHVVVPLEIERP